MARWCLPRLTQAAHRLKLRASDATKLQRAVSEIISFQNIPEGIKLMATCGDRKVQTAAKNLLSNQDDFSAYLSLLKALSNDGGPKLHSAAVAIFQSKLTQWSAQEIVRAQSTCFALIRQRPKADFSILLDGLTGDQDDFVSVRPERIKDRNHILFDRDKSSWKAADDFEIKYPFIPLVNFVHDIEFTIYSIKAPFRFRYGTYFHTRLFFEPEGNGEINFTHRSGSGGSTRWNGVKKYKVGQRFRYKLYSICGEQFLTADGRRVARRSAPVQWLRYQLNSNGESKVEITRSTLRPWLPGDDRLFELTVDEPELLNCAREPEMSFTHEDLKAVIGDSGSLKVKPARGMRFVNDSEIVMLPMRRGEFQRGKTRVKLSKDFWCSRHEITQLQWEGVTQKNPGSI